MTPSPRAGDPEQRILVVGAGIVGISTAYYLARRGAAVVIVDDGDLSSSASVGNAGILALGHPPLPRPGLVLQTMKWMLDSSGPLYVPPRFDPGLWGWMISFARACTETRFRRSTRILSELGRAAGACYRELIVAEGIECEFRPRGWLDVCATTAGLDNARHDADLLDAEGFAVEHLSAAALAEREPALDGDLAGAVHYAESASIHPGRLLLELADRATKHGATLRTGTKIARLTANGTGVTGAETDAGEHVPADTVVLAAGAWSGELGRGVGARIPLQGGKGYHVTVPALEPSLTTACVFNERHIAATPMGDGVRLAGTVELSGLNLHLHPRRVEMLTEGARPYLPAIAGATPGAAWCGLRPCTADGLPIVGWAAPSNLFVATGHAKMGLCLGPITGRLACEAILDGRPSIDLEPLSPKRFA